MFAGKMTFYLWRVQVETHAPPSFEPETAHDAPVYEVSDGRAQRAKERVLDARWRDYGKPHMVQDWILSEDGECG